ncbi:MAG: aspartate aminotransferase family protein [Cryomorphaceae bacterium]
MANTDSQSAILNDVFELIQKWMEDSGNSELPVNTYLKPEELEAETQFKLPSRGSGDRELISDIQTYLKYAVRTGHPRYVNQLFGGFNFPAFLGEVITALTNTSMYTFEVSPMATLMENELIKKMLSYTGWESGNGSFLTGGSNTNMVAMLLARNTIFKGAKHEGITGLPKLAILVSERSHFSMLKGANTIGIGQGGVVKVSLDDQGRMRGAAVEAAIEETLKKGYMPFMICSTAGTTETGSFDAIEEVSEVAEKYELWHHVDGSWGGSIILSDKRRELFRGLERADSFSWNPHKLMNIPLICSVLLVKNPNVMREEIQSHDADYIYHENETSHYDLGPGSLQCGRRVDSLKLWLAWKYFGDDGYAGRIEKLFDLANYATNAITESDDLELLFPTQTLNVNFRFKTPDDVDADRLNETIRYNLLKKGEVMVNYCRLKQGLAIRLVLLNPDVETEDIDDILELIQKEGKVLLSEK